MINYLNIRRIEYPINYLNSLKYIHYLYLRHYQWLNSSGNGKPIEYISEDKKGRIPPITKVLMNPPFPKKKTDIKEYLFIDHALEQMQNGGIQNY